MTDCLNFLSGSLVRKWGLKRWSSMVSCEWFQKDRDSKKNLPMSRSVLWRFFPPITAGLRDFPGEANDCNFKWPAWNLNTGVLSFGAPETGLIQCLCSLKLSVELFITVPKAIGGVIHHDSLNIESYILVVKQATETQCLETPGIGLLKNSFPRGFTGLGSVLSWDSWCGCDFLRTWRQPRDWREPCSCIWRFPGSLDNSVFAEMVSPSD